jgi:hypothetical protein
VTWLLLIGAGLVAETLVIVALGRHMTERYDADERCHAEPVGARGSDHPATRSPRT